VEMCSGFASFSTMTTAYVPSVSSLPQLLQAIVVRGARRRLGSSSSLGAPFVARLLLLGL
jgi:hypothetical protein